jgi:tetratricopeptide (TPR) repeat protein
MGEFEKSLAAFEEAIPMEKGYAPEYSCELAQVYLVEGYTRKAIEVLRAAKDQSPDRIDVLLALGCAYMANEQYDATAKEFRKVLKGAPG